MFWFKAHQICGTFVSTFPATYSGPGTYVLKLMGPEELVALHTEEIMEEVRTAHALYKQENKIVEPYRPFFQRNLAFFRWVRISGLGTGSRAGKIMDGTFDLNA